MESSCEKWKDRLGKLDRSCIRCDACGKASPPETCSKCNFVYYCNEACRIGHWEVHKGECKTSEAMLQQKRTLEPVIGADVKDAINNTCAICSEWPMINPAVLKCKHAFCGSCLLGWKKYNKTSTPAPTHGCGLGCPSCQHSVKADSKESWFRKAQLLEGRLNIPDMPNEKRRQSLRLDVLRHLDHVSAGDKPDLERCVYEAELLLSLGEAQKAIDIIKKTMNEDNKHSAGFTPLEDIARLRDAALETGNVAEVERLENTLVDIIERKRGGSSSSHLKKAKTQNWSALILQAEGYQKLKQWDDATETYVGMVQGMDNSSVGTAVQQHRIFLGLARCLYEKGQYEVSIGTSAMSIAMNRHYPGGYKYTALAMKAMGDVNGAITTMRLASLYETPWDDENRAEVFALYEALCLEKSQKKRVRKSILKLMNAH
jgi:tetratricopeptide (TPR) repeat protein